ncbi:MAG: Molybdopterin oxidoreductase, partial [uncultured Gemmatimonadaceae bacterium]
GHHRTAPPGPRQRQRGARAPAEHPGGGDPPPRGQGLRAGRQRHHRDAAPHGRVVHRPRRGDHAADHRRRVVDLPDLRGARRRRLQPAGDVGRVHHHLRVLGGHRARRDADLGDPLPVPGRIPHHDLPVRRGDDGVRGHDGGALPDHPHRAPVEVLLAHPVPELAADLAELQEPARLGRVRDPHVPHGLDDVPLHRAHPRHRRAARPREEPDPQGDLLGAVARLAQLRPRVAPLHAGVPVPRGARHPARALGALGGVVRLRDGAHPRLARDDLPALLRRRRHLLGDRDGLHDHHPAAEVVQPQALRHAQRPRRRGQARLVHVDGGEPRVLHGVLRRLVLGQPVRAGVLLEPRVRAVVVRGVDPPDVQRHPPAHALLAEAAAQHHLALHPLDLHQHRDVVRALRDRGALALPRVRALAVVGLPPHLGGLRHPPRLVRLVLHVVPPLHQAAPGDGAGRDQGDRPRAAARARRSGRAGAQRRPRPGRPHRTGRRAAAGSRL